jgi:hypothetical protein
MNSHFRISYLAGMLVGAMLAFPLAAQAQQQVKVNGQVVCSGDVTMSVDPAGNLNFPSCTPASNGGGGGAPTAPVCTNVTLSVTADAAANQTISSSCGNGGAAIDAYTWTAVTAGAPFPATAPTTATFSTGPFPTAGASFAYSVKAHNSVGDSNVATVTINVVAPGVCGTATANATWGSQTYDTATPSILKGGFVSYKLPVWTAANKIQYFTGVNNGAGSGNDAAHPLITEFAISQCPGDFNVPTACRTFADPINGVLKLTTRSVATPSTAGCAMTVGQQYYFNVRNVDASLTNTCQSNSCSLIVRLSGN